MLSHRQDRNPCKTEKGGGRDAQSLHLGTWRGEAGQNVLMHISEQGCLGREADDITVSRQQLQTMYRHRPLEGIVSLFFLLVSLGNNLTAVLLSNTRWIFHCRKTLGMPLFRACCNKQCLEVLCNLYSLKTSDSFLHICQCLMFFEKVAQICASIFLSLKLRGNISGCCEIT